MDEHKLNSVTALPPLSRVAKSVLSSILCLGIGLTSSAAYPATIVVDSNLDDGSDCTLRDAVVSINSSVTATPMFEPGCVNTSASALGVDDTIVFADTLASQTIALAGSALTLAASVSIDASALESLTIDSAPDMQTMQLKPSIEVNIDNLTLDRSNFVFNPPSRGGLIELKSLPSPAAATQLTVNNSTISNGYARFGGAIYAGSNTQLTLINSELSNNGASSMGGALSIQGSDSTLTLVNSQISSNNSFNGGGGVHCRQAEIIVSDGSLISDNGNGAQDIGGGIYAKICAISITDSEISSNFSINIGGGIFEDGSVVTINNSKIADNHGYFGGGGLWVDSLNLKNSIVMGNSVGRRGRSGGGIRGGVINIEGSTIANNRTDGGGGGISAGTLTISNSTVSNNTVDSSGAAIRADVATLTNVTVSDNKTDSSLNNYSSISISTSLSLINSIVANTGGGADIGSAFFGAECTDSLVTSDASSIIEDGSCGTLARAVNPGLLPLGDNGGPTPTHALSGFSYARNSGDNASCLGVDQRGETRALSVTNRCDVGAFEDNSPRPIDDGRGFKVIPLSNNKAVVVPD